MKEKKVYPKMKSPVDMKGAKVKTELVQTVVTADGQVFQQKKTEVPEGWEASIHAHRSKIGWGEDWMVMYQKALLAIVKEAKLTKNEYKLLLYLISTISYRNAVLTDLDILSKELAVAKPNVHTALKGLIKRNIVILLDRRKNGGGTPDDLALEVSFDVLNYNLAWKGNFDEGRQKRGECPPLMKEDGMTPLLPPTKDEIRRVLQAKTEIVDTETGEVMEVSTQGNEGASPYANQPPLPFD